MGMGIEHKSAGKPDALQTLRAKHGKGERTRASVWSASSLLALFGGAARRIGNKSAGKPDALQTLRAKHGKGERTRASVWSASSLLLLSDVAARRLPSLQAALFCLFLLLPLVAKPDSA